MTVKEHYNNHLGNFYSWMVGDFNEKQKAQELFFRKHNIFPKSNKIAIDLGAGNGIQSISLAKLGFNVKSIDFNKQLLNELKVNSSGFTIEIIENDFRNIAHFKNLIPELIVCCGDNIAHLDSKLEIEELIRNVYSILDQNGKLVLSFRDYSDELIDEKRFIPVKSDESRILICFLEYFSDIVRVTDIFYQYENNNWKQKISSYKKVRISNKYIEDLLLSSGFKITFNEVYRGMVTIIADRM